MGILIGLERVGHEWPGKCVLDDQTIGINEGERIGIVGRNGDGKSTLLEIVGHVLEPDAGTVTWRRGITVGYLGQADELRDNDSVRRAIFGDVPEYTWASDARIRAILDELVGDLDLDGLVGELSGGQRQALTLLMATLSHPSLMLLDEHTAALDPVNAATVMDLTKHYIEKDKLTAMMVTHNMQFAIDYGNRLIMMDEGHIIFDIKGEDKKKLTVQTLVEMFRDIRKKEFTSDETLLTDD